MKKIIFFLLSLSLVLVLEVAPVRAQENFDNSGVNVNQTLDIDLVQDEELVETEEVDLEALEAEEKFLPIPDSPFYFLQNLREKVEDLTARTPEKKAEMAMQHARRRLLEMRKLTLEKRGENIDKRLEKLQERYENRLQKAEEHAEKVGEKRDEVKNKILEKRQVQQQVLQRVLEKAPDAAKPALQRVLQRHEQRTESFIDRWETRGGKIEERLKRRQDSLQERFERRQQRLDPSLHKATEGQGTPRLNIKPKLTPRKPSVMQAPRPTVTNKRKVLGVFDKKSVWEMIKDWLL